MRFKRILIILVGHPSNCLPKLKPILMFSQQNTALTHNQEKYILTVEVIMRLPL